MPEQNVATIPLEMVGPPPVEHPGQREPSAHDGVADTRDAEPDVAVHYALTPEYTAYLKHLFTEYLPYGTQTQRILFLREQFFALAQTVSQLASPTSFEHAYALHDLQMAFLWTSLAITRNERPLRREATPSGL